MSYELADDDPALVKPTHRCPRCGGSSELSVLRATIDTVKSINIEPTRAVPCPTCAPYGPFGLVPEVVAIETALVVEVPQRERHLRQLNSQRYATLAWLLDDKPVACPRCAGKGTWQNPFDKKDTRVCYACAGKREIR